MAEDTGFLSSPKTPRYLYAKSGPFAGRTLSEQELYDESVKANPALKSYTPEQVYESAMRHGGFTSANEPPMKTVMAGIRNIPVSTARNVLNTVTGLAQVIPAVGGAAMEIYKSPEGEGLNTLGRQLAFTGQGIVDHYKAQYGSPEAIVSTLRNDPASVLADVATIASMGAGAVRTAGRTTSLAGKGVTAVGKGVSKTGLTTVGRGVEAAGEAVTAAGNAARGNSAVRAVGNFADRVDPTTALLRYAYGKTHGLRQRMAENAYRADLKFPAQMRPEDIAATAAEGWKQRIPISAEGAEKAGNMAKVSKAEIDLASDRATAAGASVPAQQVTDVSEVWNKTAPNTDGVQTVQREIWKTANQQHRELVAGNPAAAVTKGKNVPRVMLNPKEAARTLPQAVAPATTQFQLHPKAPNLAVTAKDLTARLEAINRSLSDYYTNKSKIGVHLGPEDDAAAAAKAGIASNARRARGEMLEAAGEGTADGWIAKGKEIKRQIDLKTAIERTVNSVDGSTTGGGTGPYYLSQGIQTATAPLTGSLPSLGSAIVTGFGAGKMIQRHFPNQWSNYLFRMADKYPGNNPWFLLQAQRTNSAAQDGHKRPQPEPVNDNDPFK